MFKCLHFLLFSKNIRKAKSGASLSMEIVDNERGRIRVLLIADVFVKGKTSVKKSSLYRSAKSVIEAYERRMA